MNNKFFRPDFLAVRNRTCRDSNNKWGFCGPACKRGHDTMYRVTFITVAVIRKSGKKID